MLFIRRSLGVVIAVAIMGLALVGYVELQNANRVVADVVGAVIVLALIIFAARIKI